jgi:16S rRNA (guanine966-N2)-methyltransferase
MRIVAGEYGGRRLKTAPGKRTRPTAERVREAVFSILGPVDGLRVLDLYAGSGALGIEALSRGAEHATFVEHDARTADIVRFNLAALDAVDETDVVVWDVLLWLQSVAGSVTFDLVLIDPPYSSAPRLGEPLSQLLPEVLAPNATIVTESDHRTPLELDVALWDERVYGDTRIAIHRVF